jgi:hypothetical protein
VASLTSFQSQSLSLLRALVGDAGIVFVLSLRALLCWSWAFSRLFLLVFCCFQLFFPILHHFMGSLAMRCDRVCY